jgi:hypothetical protein
VAKTLLFALGWFAMVGMSSTLAEAQQPLQLTRLKPADSEIRRLVMDGHARSRTMGDLVDELETGDAIVVVQFGMCANGRVRSCVSNVSTDGRWRHIRIKVDPRTTDDRLIATIAHELQHATEIVRNAETIDVETTLALYRRVGTRDCQAGRTDKCETEAAIQVEALVNRELSQRGTSQ